MSKNLKLHKITGIVLFLAFVVSLLVVINTPEAGFFEVRSMCFTFVGVYFLMDFFILPSFEKGIKKKDHSRLSRIVVGALITLYIGYLYMFLEEQSLRYVFLTFFIGCFYIGIKTYELIFNYYEAPEE